MARVLVTGGSGFIGTNLVAHLIARGDSVISLDIKSPPRSGHQSLYCHVDIRDPERLREAVARFAPELVIHLAARTDLHGRDLADYDTNVRGVRNMIAAVKATRAVQRAIFASSRMVCDITHRPTR